MCRVLNLYITVCPYLQYLRFLGRNTPHPSLPTRRDRSTSQPHTLPFHRPPILSCADVRLLLSTLPGVNMFSFDPYRRCQRFPYCTSLSVFPKDSYNLEKSVRLCKSSSGIHFVRPVQSVRGPYLKILRTSGRLSPHSKIILTDQIFNGSS